MSTQQSTDPSTTPTTLSEFMNSLQRLFKIGIYYPSGHPILDKATNRFMNQLAAVAGNNQTVTLHDHGDILRLEGIDLNTRLPFVQEFKTLLSALGISEIIIDRDITVAELHKFVGKMLAYKSKMLNTKKFALFEASELPHSITIKKKEFLARKDASISDNRSGEAAENLDIFFQSLVNFGLNKNEINQCKVLLESLPESLADNSVNTDDLPYASWEDVARLLAQTVKSRSDSGNRSGTRSNINALASVLSKLETETQDPKSRETINLLASIIKKPQLDTNDETVEDEEVSTRIFPDQPNLSIEQIQGHSTKNCLDQKILSSIPQSSNNLEMLSIMMQLAQHNQAIQNQMRMQQIFREVLSRGISEKAMTILGNGVLAILQGGNNTQISLIIRQLVEIVRNSRYGNSLHFFLYIIRMASENDRKKLWPYIVNEILAQGSNVDQSSYQQLCQFAASITPEEMSTALPELENLDSFQEGVIAPDIFHAVNPRCYPLFAFLLNTDIGKHVGDPILGGLRRHPADWLIKALVPLLDLSKQEHKLFLFSYLRSASHKIISVSLKNVAAKIVADSLPALSQMRRTEAWVQNTIASLSQLPTAETRALLEQIAQGKKMLFLSEWPAECRKAAKNALITSKRH